MHKSVMKTSMVLSLLIMDCAKRCLQERLNATPNEATKIFVDLSIAFSSNLSTGGLKTFGEQNTIIFYGVVEELGISHFRKYLNTVFDERNIGCLVNKIRRCSLVSDVQFTYIHERSSRSSMSDIAFKNENKLSVLKFIDPMFMEQWYMDSKRANDMNIVAAWKMGYTGKGVSICILDDGLEHSHPELKTRYVQSLSYNFNDLKDEYNDPSPRSTPKSHGTKCAGVAAAEANNGFCGVGVAYNAFICGHRILDGAVTALLEARAIAYRNKDVDIKSVSWGPKDDGRTMEAPHRIVESALQQGVLSVVHGRGGLGTIFVWAAGNGGRQDDHCGADGYVSNPNVFAIGSIDVNGNPPSYSEHCPALIAVTLVSDISNGRGLVTSTVGGKCTNDFTGTSAAAPLAAGVFALTLEANPNLTYRDLMHLVVRTAKIPDSSYDHEWILNGGGIYCSSHFGFGLLDAGRMVDNAKNWTHVKEKRVLAIDFDEGSASIRSNAIVISQLVSSRGTLDLWDVQLEHVTLGVRAILQGRRGNWRIIVTSPSGTNSTMLEYREKDDSKALDHSPFTSLHFWGERAFGKWSIKLETNQEHELSLRGIQLNSLKLELHLTEFWDQSKRYISNRSRVLKRSEIRKIIIDGQIASGASQIDKMRK